MLVVRTTEPDVAYGGTWTFELELETAQITKVTVTEEAEVRGRLLRFAVRTFGLDDAIIEGIFRAVKRKLIETPRPEASRGPRLTAPRLPANLRASPARVGL